MMYILKEKLRKDVISAHFGGTNAKIGTKQRRLVIPLHKDDIHIHELFPILRISECPNTIS